MSLGSGAIGVKPIGGGGAAAGGGGGFSGTSAPSLALSVTTAGKLGKAASVTRTLTLSTTIVHKLGLTATVSRSMTLSVTAVGKVGKVASVTSTLTLNRTANGSAITGFSKSVSRSMTISVATASVLGLTRSVSKTLSLGVTTSSTLAAPTVVNKSMSLNVSVIGFVTTGGASTGVVRWTFYDPETFETWTVPINPDGMTSMDPPQKNVLYGPGRALDTAGGAKPRNVSFLAKPPSWDWEFSGVMRTKAHYDNFVTWVSKPYPVHLTDHVGRELRIYLTDFVPQEFPKPSRIQWRLRYTVKAKILERVT